MSNQLQFKSFDFKNSPVRVIVDNSAEYWFCAKDVCDILGYLNDTKAIKDHCKEKGVTKRYSPTKGGNQETTFINEPNLYRLIIKSRKPQAEKFEAWVFEEVLPQIRKTGKYQVQPKQLTLPEPQPQNVTIPYAGRWLVITDDDRNPVVKNINGHSCVNAYTYGKLRKDVYAMTEMLQELAYRLRYIDGECSAERFSSSIRQIPHKRTF